MSLGLLHTPLPEQQIHRKGHLYDPTQLEAVPRREDLQPPKIRIGFVVLSKGNMEEDPILRKHGEQRNTKE
jgi:hypothetical protein